MVKTRLQSSPELWGIVAAKDEIVAVRCEDIVTFLDYVTQERIPVGLPEWATYPIRSKDPDIYLKEKLRVEADLNLG